MRSWQQTHRVPMCLRILCFDLGFDTEGNEWRLHFIRQDELFNLIGVAWWNFNGSIWMDSDTVRFFFFLFSTKASSYTDDVPDSSTKRWRSRGLQDPQTCSSPTVFRFFPRNRVDPTSWKYYCFPVDLSSIIPLPTRSKVPLDVLGRCIVGWGPR